MTPAPFSAMAWESVQPRFADILVHPFVTGLGDGSLPEAVFVGYLLDDAHYLASYARTLALIASRMPDTAGVGLFAGFAQGAVVAERELHRSILTPRGIDPDAPDTAPMSPACAAYTGFLAGAATTAPVEVAAAAVLPCFRVYLEVGRALVAHRHDGHPYGVWIDTYDGPAFAEAVALAERAVDALAAAAPHHDEAMLDAYQQATDLEWRFWDQAWTGGAQT
ncbi:MAG: TenA family protein [Lapillicoccus sp.]